MNNSLLIPVFNFTTKDQCAADVLLEMEILRDRKEMTGKSMFICEEGHSSVMTLFACVYCS